MNSRNQIRARVLRAALLAGAGSTLLIATMPAMAQDAPAPQATEEDAIVVTGIRETIQNSINTKREETAIVDALSADDIGDLPALSVGQAIQTITGATTHREKGDASEIALRGLGPFLSNATFNGRDASNGSGDRSVNFNQFPSELVNNIKIYKTQQASLVEGGVAGTIEIGTLRPLDFGKRRIQGEVKAQYNPYGDRITGGAGGIGWRGTLSYVDQFANDTIGIAIGVQRNDTNNPEETYAASTTWTACRADIVVTNNNCTEYDRDDYGEDHPFYLVPNAYTFRQISETDKRDAVFGSIQWRPSDQFNINLDVQYSDRTFVESRRDLNISEARRSLTDVVYDENGVIQSLSGQSAIESNGSELSRSEEYLGGGLSVEWQPSDRLTLTVDGSYSRTIRVEDERNVRLRTDPMDVNGVRTVFNNMRIPYTYEITPGSFVPTITIDPRFDLNNHDLFWDDARLRRDQSRRHNEIIAGRFDAGYEMDGFLSKLTAGVRWSEMTFRDYDVRNGDFNLNPAIAEDRRINNLCRNRAFPQTGFLSDASGNSINSWATFDVDCLFREYMGSEDPGALEDKRSPANRDVTERTLAGYIMADYDADLGNMPVRGNIGVRVVKTDVTSNGLRSDLVIIDNGDGTIRLDTTGDFETVTIKSSNTRILPSINAIFEVAPNTLLRVAGYRAMSRPAPSALGAGRTFQIDADDFTSVEEAIGNVRANGSPRLKPLMSWNADAAIEWYPNKDSLLSATVYYKQFNGGFQPEVFDEEFVIDGQSVTVPVTQTRNSPDKSRIYGLELTAATRFSFLPKPLDGLGAKVSYNYADSNFENQDVNLGDQYNPETETVSPGIIPAAGLSGYSKHVLSAQAYYELGPVSLQAIYNYRSKYYQDFVGGNSQLRYVGPSETVDFRASLDLMRGVSLRFEALNIFNEPKATYMPVYGSSRQYHYYGAKYFIGIRARI